MNSERVKKLVGLFEEDSDMTSLSSQTGSGFLMDEGVPKFEEISNSRRSPRIIHPMYLYIDRWGGRELRVYLSQKLTALSVTENEIGSKNYFNYWVPSKGAAVVVKRYLSESDYQDDATLDAAIKEALKESARVYLMCCVEQN